MAQIVLTAARISPAKSDLSRPKRIVLQSEQVISTKAFKYGTSILYGSGNRPYRKYRVYETPGQYLVAADPTSSLLTNKDLAVIAGGSTQATAVQLSKYYNVAISAIPAASTGLKLPNVASLSLHSDGTTKKRGTVVIVNSTSDTLSVFAASATHTIDGSSTVAATVGPFSRRHFVTSSSVAWLSDNGYE